MSRQQLPAQPIVDLDPLALSPVDFAQVRLKWRPDPEQCRILADPRKRVILNWGRQSGKSTVAAAKMLHLAITVESSTCVWISSAKEHTAEVFARMRVFLAAISVKPASQRGFDMALVFPNGSRILGLAARNASVRSYTANLLVIDEAAQVDDQVHDAATALLAVREGQLWMLGTPQGESGRFYEIWTRGDESEWCKSQRRSIDSGRVSTAFIDSERRIKGDAVVSREYECQFQANGEKLLRQEDIRRIFRNQWTEEEHNERPY